MNCWVHIMTPTRRNRRTAGNNRAGDRDSVPRPLRRLIPVLPGLQRLTFRVRTIVSISPRARENRRACLASASSSSVAF